MIKARLCLCVGWKKDYRGNLNQEQFVPSIFLKKFIVTQHYPNTGRVCQWHLLWSCLNSFSVKWEKKKINKPKRLKVISGLAQKASSAGEWRINKNAGAPCWHLVISPFLPSSLLLWVLWSGSSESTVSFVWIGGECDRSARISPRPFLWRKTSRAASYIYFDNMSFAFNALPLGPSSFIDVFPITQNL